MDGFRLPLDPVNEAEEIRRISAEKAKAFHGRRCRRHRPPFFGYLLLMATVGQTRPAPAQVKVNSPSVFDRYDTTLASGYEDVRVDGGPAYGSGFARVA